MGLGVGLGLGLGVGLGLGIGLGLGLGCYLGEHIELVLHRITAHQAAELG